MSRLPSLSWRSIRSRPDESGQVLVIVAAGLISLIAMVGLVIDGGHAWGRQRITQNGADSVAKAGSVVVLQWLGGEATKTAGDVGCAVNLAALEGNVDVESAEFTDEKGDPINISVPENCVPGGGGAMPLDAQGVKAETSQEFDTFLMSVVGITQLTARANATAIVGPVTGTGVALPVTFPQTLDLCDNSGEAYTIRDWNEEDDGSGLDNDDVWEPYEILPAFEILPAYSQPTAANMSTIPLCTSAPGSVGWLDYGCGNLADHITDPCDIFVPIPGWVQTHTGNINCCELELATYHGNDVNAYEEEGVDLDGDIDVEVKIPIHTTTCEEAPTPGATNFVLTPCPDGQWTGQGNNLAYGVPFWVAFILNEAYVQGGDTECTLPPGTPLLTNPGGGVGCLKGWFVQRIGPPDAVSIGDVNPGDDVDIGITLIN